MSVTTPPSLRGAGRCFSLTSFFIGLSVNAGFSPTIVCKVRHSVPPDWFSGLRGAVSSDLEDWIVVVNRVGVPSLEQFGMPVLTPYKSDSRVHCDRRSSGNVMGTKHDLQSPSIQGESSPVPAVAWVCLVIAACYLAPKLEGALIQNPQMIWPLWPGSARSSFNPVAGAGGVWPILFPRRSQRLLCTT